MRRKIYLLIPFLLSFKCSYSQDTIADKFGKTEITNMNLIRFGLGVQKSFYTELGVSRNVFVQDNIGAASLTYYSALEFTPSFSKNRLSVYGLKGGIEYCTTAGGLTAMCLEIKYLSNFEKEDVIITPKAGLSAFGLVSIFYGYNLSILHDSFPQIGHHQLSIIININKKTYNEYMLMKKTE